MGEIAAAAHAYMITLGIVVVLVRVTVHKVVLVTVVVKNVATVVAKVVLI